MSGKVISAPFGGAEQPRNVLLEIANDDSIDGFVIVTKHKDGRMRRSGLNVSYAEEAFAGAILAQRAVDESG